MLYTTLLIAGIAAYAAPTASPVVEEAAVAEIRKLYAETNAAIKTAHVVKKDLDESTAGGGMTAWFVGKDLQKIAIEIMGEMGQTTEEFYYHNKRPVFIFWKGVSYHRPFGKVSSVKEIWLYFKDGALVRCLEGKKRISTSDANCKAHAAEALDEALKRAADAQRL